MLIREIGLTCVMIKERTTPCV